MKEDTVRKVGFARLAIFRPGIIVGNAHTPAWVGRLEASCLGRLAILIALHSREAGEVTRVNAAMKKAVDREYIV